MTSIGQPSSSPSRFSRFFTLSFSAIALGWMVRRKRYVSRHECCHSMHGRLLYFSIGRLPITRLKRTVGRSRWCCKGCWQPLNRNVRPLRLISRAVFKDCWLTFKSSLRTKLGKDSEASWCCPCTFAKQGCQMALGLKTTHQRNISDR